MTTVLAVLSLVGMIVLVVAIWYGVSFAVLATVSKLLPLTGRRRTPERVDPPRIHTDGHG